MNVAFYGAGTRAQPYLQVLARRADVVLTAVCDADPRAAEAIAAGWGAKLHRSYETLLQEERPDALWICPDTPLPADVVLRAAETRVPFFLEPPLAVNYDLARLQARQLARAPLVTTVGFTGRSADVVQEAREYLGANPIPLALGWWLSPGEDDSPAAATQALWKEGCRLVDLLRLYCGEVRRVRALAAGGETTASGLVVQLEFAGGTVGVLTCATFARPEPRRELELLGDGWSLGFADGLATLRVAERDKTTILRCLNQPIAQQVTAFLAAVEAGDPAAVAPDYDDALRTFAVCHAAALSAAEGRPIELTEVGIP